MPNEYPANPDVLGPASVGETFVVAAIQTVSGPDVAANLAVAGQLVAEAAAAGARLAVLPEYFGIMGLRDTDKLAAAEADGTGPIQAFLSDTARRHGIWLIGGSVPLQSPEPARVFNSLLVYDETGARAARYDKIHLFGLDLAGEKFSEARTIVPGHDVRTVDSPFGRIGLSVCYDVRFPELYRAMGEVDIIVVPSAFTSTTGKAHWETLLRARAIENLAYVVAPAQGGVHPSGRETHGHSMVIDPWGAVLACREKSPGIVIATIDPSYRKRMRQSLPALAHRVLVPVR